MNVIKKYWKKFYTTITKYIYTNRLFLSYLIIASIGTVILRDVTINGDYIFKPLITDIGLILLIGAFGYLIKPKNQFKYYFIWLIIFSLLEIVNSIYFIFYASFASLSELATLSQVKTVTDSVFVELRFIDFVYIFQPIIFYYIHRILKSSTYYHFVSKIENKKIMFTTTLVMSFLCIFYSFATAQGYDYSRLTKQWDRNYIVERFGIILYQLNDTFQSIKPKLTSLFGYEDAYKLFNDYFNDEEVERYDNKNKYTNILNGYNIVYIHMESMQTFLMDLEFNGEEVTPYLNKLAKEGMFFSNFYPQVSIGTSSDAEYIMLTGLLPSLNGTVFINYPNNKFNTIATNLKSRGYYTFSMHGNYPVMWGRNKIHPNLGYTDMYFHDSFTFDDKEGSPDVVGLGINDKLFFEQAVQKLTTIEDNNKNYFGTLITLSNHSSWPDNPAFTLDINDYYTDEITKEEKSSCYLCSRDVGRYIVSSHYADEALGDFIKYIKESDHFNNTVFVFYGDHDAKLSYKDMNFLYNYDYLTGKLKDKNDPTYITYDSYDHNLNKKTPLIIWTKNSSLSKKLKGEVDTVMGMYDVAPTLYNMLGIENKYVLGHDIFNIKDNNIVVFPNGNYLTSKVYYHNSTGEYKALGSDVTLDINYIRDNLEYTEKALEIGNAIINYDLFNEKKRDE